MSVQRATKIKTFDELMCAVLDILPNAQIEDDNEGQLIIYTNLILTDNDEVEEMG